MSEVTNKPRGKPFPPGVSPNPAGRPRGSRNAFSAIFVGDLTASGGMSAQDLEIFQAIKACYCQVLTIGNQAKC